MLRAIFFSKEAWELSAIMHSHLSEQLPCLKLWDRSLSMQDGCKGWTRWELEPQWGMRDDSEHWLGWLGAAMVGLSGQRAAAARGSQVDTVILDISIHSQYHLSQVGVLKLAEMGLPVLRWVLRAAVETSPWVSKHSCMGNHELPKRNQGDYSCADFQTT